MTVTLMDSISFIKSSEYRGVIWHYRIKVGNDVIKSDKEYLSKAAAEKAGKRVLNNLWNQA